MKVQWQDLSPYQKSLIDLLDINFSEKTQKLIPHLEPRKKYIVHYRMLKFLIEKGIRLKRIRRIISFTQKIWLREYIEFNTKHRQMATHEIERDLFKFLVNACYGKSCENVRKHKQVKICTSLEEAKKCVNSQFFRRFDIVTPNVVVVEMGHKYVHLNKAIYTGFVCLELSKLVMYKFHMDVMKKFYGNRAVLLQTDTDNLNYCINTQDLYEDLKCMKDHFDFSDYPKEHPLYSEVNKKVLGKFKDESNSVPIKEFCGLSPKMYSFVGDNIWKKAAKGVKKSVVQRCLLHSTFKHVLMKQKKINAKMNLIRSRKHILYTVQVEKSSLHPFDSKRYILKDGITTLPYNHFLIRNSVKKCMQK